MKRNQFLLSVILVLGSIWTVKAQEEKPNNFNIGVQLRPRAEYRNGYKKPLFEDDKSSGLINQRTRLSIDYQREGLSANLSLQNVSIWGEYPYSNAKNSNTAIYEAWAQLKSENGFFAKFGRQVLHYADGRLLSVADFNQASRSHDALKFGYQTNSHQVDAILAYNQDVDRINGGTYYFGTGIPYKTMQALYYQNNMISDFTPSFLFVNVGYEVGNQNLGETKLANLQTFGTYLTYKPVSRLRLQGNAFYQMGERKGISEKISAYMLTLKAEYDVIKPLKFTAGTDYLSGEEYQSPNGNSTYNSFLPLYGGNHGLYGVMDLFIDDPYNTGMNIGIWDKFLGVSVKPSSKTTLGLTYHHFSTGSDVYRIGEKIKNGLGSEIDLQFDYNLMKDVKLTCGYSTFFGTSTTDYVKGGDHKVWQDWAFVSVIVNPKIFSTKW
ncbi:MAG: alginate export family protein [Paludibacteraceae bacterium]